MKIVLDTNVLVAGLLSAFGPPAQILRLLVSGDLITCYDARIIKEYSDVLNRPKFGFNKDAVVWLLDYIVQNGQAVAALTLTNHLPDADDEAFLEVAISGQADVLVTGNLSHFPKRLFGKMSVLSPADFLSFYKKNNL
jgi:putative PIN family toxin of toxin-antitoxin system